MYFIYNRKLLINNKQVYFHNLILSIKFGLIFAVVTIVKPYRQKRYQYYFLMLVVEE